VCVYPAFLGNATRLLLVLQWTLDATHQKHVRETATGSCRLTKMCGILCGDAWEKLRKRSGVLRPWKSKSGRGGRFGMIDGICCGSTQRKLLSASIPTMVSPTTLQRPLRGGNCPILIHADCHNCPSNPRRGLIAPRPDIDFGRTCRWTLPTVYIHKTRGKGPTDGGHTGTEKRSTRRSTQLAQIRFSFPSSANFDAQISQLAGQISQKFRLIFSTFPSYDRQICEKIIRRWGRPCPISLTLYTFYCKLRL
jgi:hypothetical protein